MATAMATARARATMPAPRPKSCGEGRCRALDRVQGWQWSGPSPLVGSGTRVVKWLV